MKFSQKLKNAWLSNNSLVCVGLDPSLEKMPASLTKNHRGILDFNKAIIDATGDLVCAYKPQIAYYAAIGAETILEQTIDYIHQKFPTIPIVLDAKRGDIGSTAAMYAKEAFDRYQADAVTVNPYMGFDTIEPYLEYSDKGTIVLCHTSNPGAVEIQEKTIHSDGTLLYQYIAQTAANLYEKGAEISLVVGATVPEELKAVRSIVGNMPLLVPGLGAQGGDLVATISNGVDSEKTGMMVNNSRAIIYAGSGDDFAVASRQETIAMRDSINTVIKNI